MNLGFSSGEFKQRQLVDKFSGSSLYLHNTPHRKKELFKSIVPGEVKMYSCGPTVYSEAHLGNLRAYILPDILKKVLGAIGYRVFHIINITDVGHLTDDASDGEDKMERQAHRNSETVWDISQRYTESFCRDITFLNIKDPNKFTKATAYIQEQIDMIGVLEKKGHTYLTEDGVYFDTSTFPDYPKFAGLDVANLYAGERVDIGQKRNSTDFALWKFSSKDGPKRQMEWQSPWGVGFPGWHLECSAMILSELGKEIDIHTGGIDHISVHHTNEVAQATCCTGKSPAKYWLHGEFLVLDGEQKIGKSQGNSLLLRDFMKKGFDPLAFRYLILSAHYRSPLKFSEKILLSCQKGLESLRRDIRKIFDVVSKESNIQLSDRALQVAGDTMSFLLDDLNTAGVLAKIREIIQIDDIDNKEKILIIHFFDQILCLDLIREPDKSIEIPIEVKTLADERIKAKKEKNWQHADNLRGRIEEMGFKINDTKDGYELVSRT